MLRRRRALSSDPPRDVFVFRIGQLGDTLVALPAIQRIAERHAGARLWLITNAPAEASFVSAWDVLQHAGLFRGVLFYDRHTPRALLRLVLRLRRAQAAVVYYLSPPRSAARLRRDRWFLRYACGVSRIAAMPEPRPLVLRDARGRLRVLPRESERLLRSVDPYGALPTPPSRRPTAAALRRADELLMGLGERPLIALGPGSKMPAKRWFLPRFSEVCRRTLAQNQRAVVLVLGGAEDRELGLALERELGAERLRNLAGQTDIIESAAVLARCSLYVGNDTGTMHLAASMGVPCVAIFTSRDNRDTWSPWGEQHAVLRRELACSGCMLERCEREQMRCLDLISVEDVWCEVAKRLPEAGEPVLQPATRGS
jgi:ADP-heptose:LPS heptosyltransferase